MQSTRVSTAEQGPFRPYFWLRRITVAIALSLAILLVLRTIAAHVAEHRWQSTAARLAVAGIGIDITALQPPPVDDQDNAAWYLKSATAALDPKDQGARASIYDSDTLGEAPSYTPLWHQLVDDSEAANVRAFALARSARPFNRVDWGVIFKPPGFGILLPHLNGARALANVLADGAERSFLRGESAEGIERVRDIIHLSDCLDDRPFIVTGLVHAGIDAVAAEVVARHVGSLRVGPAADDPTRVAMRGLIGDLLRDAQHKNLELASKVARAESVGSIGSGRALADSLWVARPTVVADLARLGERQLALIDAVDAPSYGERETRLAKIPKFMHPANSTARLFAPNTGEAVRVSRPIAHTAAGDLPPKSVASFEIDAFTRDACAIMLAVRLYEVDHARRWPATLDALVPDYLPAVPTSKVADTPYAYILVPHGLPDGRDRPLLLRTSPTSANPLRPTTRPSTPGDRRPIIDLTSW